MIAVALSLLAAGYALGRIDRLREGSRSLRARVSMLSWRDPLPELPALGEEGRTYDELTEALDRRLLQERSTPAWRRLPEAPSEEAYSKGVRAMRAKLIAALRPWPGPRAPLEPVEQAWFSEAGVEAILVRFETHPGITMLCLLLRPVAAPGARLPAILALHGQGGNLRSLAADLDYHHGFAMELARRGFVVLAPVRATGDWRFRGTLSQKATVLGWRLEALELWQLVRALDYLYDLPGVDPEHVGLYGISFGGQQALTLGAIDLRPSLVLVSGHFTDRFRWMFSAYREGGPRLQWLPEGQILRELGPSRWVGILPAMDPLLDDRNLVALVAPRYFAVESGTRDPRHREAVAAYEDVAGMYARLGLGERSAFLAFEGDHETSLSSALPFLERWSADPRPGDPGKSPAREVPELTGGYARAGGS